MKKNFKYKIAVKCYSQKQVNDLAEKLKTLGYEEEQSMTAMEYRPLKYKYLFNFTDQARLFVGEETSYPTDLNFDANQDNWEYILAVAAMVKGEEFNADEWVVIKEMGYNNSSHLWYRENCSKSILPKKQELWKVEDVDKNAI